jgi:hypothetical protein
MDKTLTELDEDGTAAAEDAEGQRAMTHHNIDMAQSALCVLQTVFGALPQALQASSYGGDETAAFYTAWRQFDFGVCAQLQALTTPAGQHAREYVLRCTDSDPAARPQTGLEALSLPFLHTAVQQLSETKKAATEQWKQAHRELFALLGIGQQSWSPLVPAVADSNSDRGSGNYSSSSARDSNGSCDCPPTVLGSNSPRSKGCNDTCSNKAANGADAVRASAHAHGSAGGSSARAANAIPDVQPRDSSPLGTTKPSAGVCDGVLHVQADGGRGGACRSMFKADSIKKHRPASSPAASSEGASAQASATASTGRLKRAAFAVAKSFGWACGGMWACWLWAQQHKG